MVRRAPGMAMMALMCLATHPATATERRGGLIEAGAEGQPWSQGVPADVQQRADALFADGLDLIEKASFARAIEPFQKALALWDHPAIHLSLAKAYLNQAQPAAALEHFWATMRYGGRPLPDADIALAERYAKLVYQQDLTHLVIRSDERGLVIKLDGAVVLGTPGTWQGVVKAGANIVVAERSGREVARLADTFPAGQRIEIVFANGARPGTGGTLASVSRRVPTEADLQELELALVHFRVKWPATPFDPSSIRLPPRLEAICDKATGDLATVCAEYERLYRQTEIDKAGAEKRMEELTRGGVVEVLQ